MRTQGWESRLAEFLASPPAFQWGVSDCALWCARWVAIATDQDFSHDSAGRYGTAEEALAHIGSLGYSSPADIADQHLQRVPVNFAQRGDIVLHTQGPLGICNGVNSHFLTEAGYTREPTRSCLVAWSVE